MSSLSPHIVDMLFLPRADLTHEENARLDAAGLDSKMLADWDHLDIFARYHNVGIEAG